MLPCVQHLSTNRSLNHIQEVTMTRLAHSPHADQEPVTVNYRYGGRVAEDRARWVFELPAGTPIEDGSILHVAQTLTDSTASPEDIARRTFRMRDTGQI